MLCRLRSTASTMSKARMTTLVATEQFPVKDTLTPKASVPAVVKSNKLQSGIQTISRDYNSSIVTLKFAINGGSGSEAANAKGAAQFLATAAFAGNHDHTGLKLVNHLHSLGASFDASSDKEKIVYDVKVLSDKAESVIAAVMNAIASPPHSTYVLEEWRSAAELDYNKFRVCPSAQLRELIHEAAFGEASALGSSIYAPNLKKLAVSDVLQYRTAHFVQGNVVVAGNGISQDRLDATVNQWAPAIPAGAARAQATTAFVGGEVKVRTDLSGTSRFGLAFHVPAGEAGKPYIVLNSLIATKLASQKQCANTFVQTFAGANGGLFGVEAGTAQQLDAVIAELKAIATQAPDIEFAKQKITLEYFLGLEGANGAATLLCAHARGLNAQTAGDVRSVTAAAVSAAAATALKSNPAYAVLGATAGTPSFATLTKSMK